MYNFSIIDKPLRLTFSRNPIRWGFRISPWTSNEVSTNTSLILTLVATLPGQAPSSIKTLTLRPDNTGYCSVDLSSLLDAQLEFTVPSDVDFYFSLPVAKLIKQYLSYSLSVRLQNDYEPLLFKLYGSADPVYNYGIDDYRIIKGGLNRANANISNYFADNIVNKKEFLRFPAPGEMASIDDLHWLTAVAYLPIDDFWIGQGAIVKIARTRTFADGTSTTVNTTADVRVKMGEVFCVQVIIPEGDNSNLQSITTQVSLLFDDDTYILAQQTFLIDKLGRYEAKAIYHNSLGGINRINFLNVEKLNYDYDKVFATVLHTDRFLSKNVIAADIAAVAVSERAKPTLVTPLMSQAELQNVRDLFLRKSAWFLRNGRYLPFNPEDATLDIANYNGMYALGITVAEALNEINFTPNNHVAQGAACAMPIDLQIVQVDGDACTISWQFPPGVYAGRIEVLNHISNEVIQKWDVFTNSGTVTLVQPDLLLVYDSYKNLKVRVSSRCGAYSFSDWLTSATFKLYYLMPPFVPNRYATTFKGDAERTLSYAAGTDNLLETVEIYYQPPGIDCNLVQALMVTGDPVPDTATGTAGGTFVRVGPNVDRDVTLKYTPPSAVFTGLDKLEYKVVAYDTNANHTTESTGILYVTVGDGIADGDTPAPVGNGLFVKLVMTDHNANVIENNLGSPVTGQKFSKFTLFFYSDPYGLYPLFLEPGNGVTILLQYYDEYYDSTVNIPITNIVGTSKYLGWLLTYWWEDGGLFVSYKSSNITYTLAESDQYIAI